MDAMKARDAIEEMRSLFGPATWELAMEAAQKLPPDWLDWPPDRAFEHVRCLFKYSQDDLSLKSGVAQSIVSRVEGGFDAKLSTWTRLYAAMGLKLILVPYSDKTLEELQEEARSTIPSPTRPFRQKANPRRRWIRNPDGTVTDRAKLKG